MRSGRNDNLTEREKQVYHLLGQGRSAREIANSLGITYHTAKTYIRNAREKMENSDGTLDCSSPHYRNG